ncbi:MAG: hypothetical protein NTV80_01185 [Verrucomicrobia bacterium]|nr:hypothetical protein [Verrucomicrobiota bacterium]
MKQNNLPLGLAGFGFVFALAPMGLAQQAPSYGYQQPRYAQPQYQVPPGYSVPQQQVYSQQGYAPPPQSQYVSPAEFLPTFGRKFGSMFRKLFYGDAPPAGYAQPVPGYSYPQQGRGNLDQPPQGYSQPYAAPSSPAPNPSYPPRYEVAPAPKSTPPAMPPTSRMNSGSSKTAPTAKKKSAPAPQSKSSKTKTSTMPEPARKYTPPSISREPSKPEIEDQPPASFSSRTEPTKLPGSKPSSDLSSGSSKSTSNGAASSGSFLRGKKASKEGRVISPYPPYRELDVSGLSSGSLALDPTTQKVFEVP